jgi:glycosyltransferase involved in cell wall biosynthesis
VIYDIHEDVPHQVLSKRYVPQPLRSILAFIVAQVEDFAARQFSALVTVTPTIAKRFAPFNSRTHIINNYAVVKELNERKPADARNDNPMGTCIGAITKDRGILEIANAMALLPSHLNARLMLAGTFSSDEFRETTK